MSIFETTAQPGAPPHPPPTRGLSITDFLTDGSLAALCEEFTTLLGVEATLRDARGRTIVPARAPDGAAWEVVEPGAGGAPSLDDLARAGHAVFPLAIGDRTIGAITLGPGQPRVAPGDRASIERVLALLAQTTREVCEREEELRHRIREVTAVYRVSSLLARAAGPQRVLDVALESVIDAMQLDCGAIMLLRQDFDGIASDNEEDLQVAASRNLSKRWLDHPQPLSKGRLFDRLALNGQVVASEDLLSDDRVLIPELAAQEGLGAALHAGLVFQNRAIGLFRLYSRRPRQFTEEDRRLLRSIAQQAAVAVEQARLMNLEREKQRVQRQIDLAADVQQRMLPRGSPNIPGLDVAARYHPSLELGGDFYDFLELNGHVGVVVGDVVGKGIAAALLMAAVRASLRAHVQEIYDLDEVIRRVNVAMCHDTRDNEFASLWYGVIDPVRLRLTYCSAGHEPTFVVHMPKGRPPGAQDVGELNVGGMVVGVDPEQRYQRAVFDLRPRDVLVAFTDGVVDTTNFEGVRFGRARLRDTILAALAENPDRPAADLIERIQWELRRFAGLSPRPDDFTIVVVRVGEGGSRRAPGTPGSAVAPGTRPGS